MTSEQLLPVLIIAMVVNVVIIVVALISMRTSGARSRKGKEPDLAGTSGMLPAMAVPVSSTAAVPVAAMATGPELAFGASEESDRDEGPPDTDVRGAGDSSRDVDAMLLDPTTGLESPLAWRHTLDDEFTRLARYHRQATLILVELDGFDRLIDRLGEAAGARVVLATARTLRAEARAADRVARLGRGRFAILLPETDEVSAVNFVERIRSACDRWLEAGEIALRLAIGWTILDPNDGASTALLEAERRLDTERRQRAGSRAGQVPPPDPLFGRPA